MTAHELAKVLLNAPDLPVVINGWGSDEGLGPFEVTRVELPEHTDYCNNAHLKGDVLHLNYD